jgi:DNA repair exonuclease SbcCD nuclease subunit
VKIVHAADLHLDSPLLGLTRYEKAPVEAIRGATRRAFDKLMALCVEERAQLLLIAGDVFDGDWRDYSTGLFFASALLGLREVGTRVVIVRGNHDAASQITKNLELPEHVFELPSGHPDTVTFEDIGVACHGQSFRDRAVSADLASRYPEPSKGLFNVGLLHTSLTGREGHADYAPTTVATLAARGYDYWALGHVHRREVVSEAPMVVYPGNLQGRHARETGSKGATLIDVTDGRIASVEHRALDVVRWTVCEVDASEVASGDDVVALVQRGLDRELRRAEGRTLAVRVVLRGATRAHATLVADAARWEAQIRLAGSDVGGDELWIERILTKTSSELDRTRLAEREDAVGQLVRALERLRDDRAEQYELVSVFTELWQKLPPEVREGPDAVRLDDPDFIRDALDDIEGLILPELLSPNAGSFGE